VSGLWRYQEASSDCRKREEARGSLMAAVDPPLVVPSLVLGTSTGIARGRVREIRGGDIALLVLISVVAVPLVPTAITLSWLEEKEISWGRIFLTDTAPTRPAPALVVLLKPKAPGRPGTSRLKEEDEEEGFGLDEDLEGVVAAAGGPAASVPAKVVALFLSGESSTAGMGARAGTTLVVVATVVPPAAPDAFGSIRRARSKPGSFSKASAASAKGKQRRVRRRAPTGTKCKRLLVFSSFLAIISSLSSSSSSSSTAAASLLDLDSSGCCVAVVEVAFFPSFFFFASSSTTRSSLKDGESSFASMIPLSSTGAMASSIRERQSIPKRDADDPLLQALASPSKPFFHQAHRRTGEKLPFSPPLLLPSPGKLNPLAKPWLIASARTVVDACINSDTAMTQSSRDAGEEERADSGKRRSTSTGRVKAHAAWKASFLS
jgi:hypothetical protein